MITTTDKSSDYEDLVAGEKVIEVSDAGKTSAIKLTATAKVDAEKIAITVTPVILVDGNPSAIDIKPGDHSFMLGLNDAADPAVALQQAVEAEALRAHRIAKQLAAWEVLGIPEPTDVLINKESNR